MSTITIHFKDKEEETLIQNILQKMKISFEKSEDDFELTDEMKKIIDERLLEDESCYVDAEEALQKISEKYGL